MKPEQLDNLKSNSQETDDKNCPVCRELLIYLKKFFDMPQDTHRSKASDWLTVGEIASELKISKSIVYRLIRNGEIEAVNIVETNGKVAQKGHYRVSKSCLNKYLELKKVKSLPAKADYRSHPVQFPKVKNYLGI